MKKATKREQILLTALNEIFELSVRLDDERINDICLNTISKFKAKVLGKKANDESNKRLCNMIDNVFDEIEKEK